MFFGGPIYANQAMQMPQTSKGYYPIVEKAQSIWDKMLELFIQTFGNAGTAILIVFLAVFFIWVKFGKRP